MAYIGPSTQSRNYTHMHEFMDIRGDTEHILPNKDSVLDVIKTHKDFTFFNKLVKISNMESVFNNTSFNSTIFIPSDMMLNDDAFTILDGLDAGKADFIIKSTILKNKIISELLQESKASYFTTLTFERIFVTNVNGRTYLNNCSENFSKYNSSTSIIHTDILCNNGIIHIIDGLILPKVIL